MVLCAASLQLRQVGCLLYPPLANLPIKTHHVPHFAIPEIPTLVPHYQPYHVSDSLWLNSVFYEKLSMQWLRFFLQMPLLPLLYQNGAKQDSSQYPKQIPCRHAHADVLCILDTWKSLLLVVAATLGQNLVSTSSERRPCSWTAQRFSRRQQSC